MKSFDKHFRMSESDAVRYAKEKLDLFGADAELKAREIGDGNINYVYQVWDPTSGSSVIIKQADTVLRSSGRPLDVNRNKIEAHILMLQAQYAPDLVPKIYHYDPVMCALCMEDVSGYKNLRTELMARKTFPKLADDITSFMVRTLLPTCDLVMKPAEKKQQVKEYINPELCDISEDLVFTEPYIDYKGRNIVLDENLDFVKKELYQDQALILEAAKLKNNFKNNAQALIHGDLHSGSIFANQEGTKVLDPEFAFYGPMGYDLGNVVGNLFFALANALVCEKDQEKKEQFTTWLRPTIISVVDLFSKKFLDLFSRIATDPTAKTPGFAQWYLESVLSDAAGSAGLEIIRRTVGDAKVAEVSGVEVLKQRIPLERLLILTGKEMILRRDQLKTGADYIDLFQRQAEKTL